MWIGVELSGEGNQRRKIETFRSPSLLSSFSPHVWASRRRARTMRCFTKAAAAAVRFNYLLPFDDDDDDSGLSPNERHTSLLLIINPLTPSLNPLHLRRC